jgi:uncharacterized membrane protein
MTNEPVALLAALAVIAVNIAALFGVVLDTSAVETILIDIVFLVTAIAQRSKVTPVDSPRLR